MNLNRYPHHTLPITWNLPGICTLVTLALQIICTSFVIHLGLGDRAFKLSLAFLSGFLLANLRIVVVNTRLLLGQGAWWQRYHYHYGRAGHIKVYSTLLLVNVGHKFMGAVTYGVSSCPKKIVFASLCSFICLQAVYQLSGPACKSTWKNCPCITLLTFISHFVIDFLSIRNVIIFSAIATDDRHPLRSRSIHPKCCKVHDDSFP